jgi:hypothetical protein
MQAWVRVQKVLDSKQVYYLVVGGVLLALGSSLMVSHQQHQLTRCVAAYADRQNANQQLRADAAAAERESIDALFKALDESIGLPPGQTASAIKKAFSDYRERRAFNDGRRQGNPMPAPPSEACG